MLAAPQMWCAAGGVAGAPREDQEVEQVDLLVEHRVCGRVVGSSGLLPSTPPWSAAAAGSDETVTPSKIEPASRSPAAPPAAKKEPSMRDDGPSFETGVSTSR